jgi:hypothetical protein
MKGAGDRREAMGDRGKAGVGAQVWVTFREFTFLGVFRTVPGPVCRFRKRSGRAYVLDPAGPFSENLLQH